MHHLQAHLEGPNSANLWQYGWRDACDIVGLLAADGETVSAWLAGDEALNTLTWPVLEYQSLDVFQVPAVVRKQRNVAALLRLADKLPNSLQVATGEEPSLTDCFRSARLLLEATVLLGEQRVEEALARIDEGMPQAARHTQFRELAVEVYFNQAKGAVEANDAASASSYYRKIAQALDDDNAAGHWQLATLFQQSGELYEAADQYYTALQSDPQNIDLRVEFAYLLADMQKSAQAIGQFEQILQAHPSHPPAHLGLGLVLLMQNDELQAQHHLTQAVALDPALREVVMQAGIRLSAD